MTKNKSKKKVVIIVLVSLLILCLICFIVSLFIPDTQTAVENLVTQPTPEPPTTAPTPSQAETYFEQYGGSLQVYEDILLMTDCAILQEKFDLAAGNNDRATPGTKESSWTLGYMMVADDRMEELGCYE